MAIIGEGDFKISFNGKNVTLPVKEVSADTYEQNPLEYEFEDQHGIQLLKKRGNRWIWKIVYYLHAGNKDIFYPNVKTLMGFNGQKVTITPHVDKPDIQHQAWLVCFLDRFNEYPTQKLEIEMEAVNTYAN